MSWQHVVAHSIRQFRRDFKPEPPPPSNRRPGWLRNHTCHSHLYFFGFLSAFLPRPALEKRLARGVEFGQRDPLVHSWRSV